MKDERERMVRARREDPLVERLWAAPRRGAPDFGALAARLDAEPRRPARGAGAGLAPALVIALALGVGLWLPASPEARLLGEGAAERGALLARRVAEFYAGDAEER